MKLRGRRKFGRRWILHPRRLRPLLVLFNLGTRMTNPATPLKAARPTGFKNLSHRRKVMLRKHWHANPQQRPPRAVMRAWLGVPPRAE